MVYERVLNSISSFTGVSFGLLQNIPKWGPGSPICSWKIREVVDVAAPLGWDQSLAGFGFDTGREQCGM